MSAPNRFAQFSRAELVALWTSLRHASWQSRDAEALITEIQDVLPPCAIDGDHDFDDETGECSLCGKPDAAARAERGDDSLDHLAGGERWPQ